MTFRFARIITLALAAIQLAAPAVASVAEGVFSSRVVDATAHVEDRAQSDCVAPHGADCVVCRYLVDNVGGLPAAPLAVEIVAEQPTPVVAASRAAGADRQGFDARGPPATWG